MTVVCNAYLESQYNLRMQHPEHHKIKAESQERSDWVRKKLPMRHDISCGASKNATFDLIHGKGQRYNQPVVIFIHGGFWRSGDKQDCAFIGESFYQHGVATVLLNYSLAPASSLAAIIKEVRISVANIVAQAPELGLDSERIILGGHSAGGHLAAMVESTDWTQFNQLMSPVSASFGVSGLYDPRPLSQTSFQQILALPEDGDHLVAKPSKAGSQGLDLVACGLEETQELQSQSKRYADDINMYLNYNPMYWSKQRDHYSILLDLADVQSDLFRRIMSLFPL